MLAADLHDLQIVDQRCTCDVVNIYDIGIKPYLGYRNHTTARFDSYRFIFSPAKRVEKGGRF